MASGDIGERKVGGSGGVGVSPQPACYAFGAYCLYPEERLLLRDGQPVPLAPKAFELLTVLAASEGRLLRREALMKALWPDSFVEEINLTVNVSLLRKVLGEPAGGEYIATVPKQGYRFVMPVQVGTGRTAEVSPAAELSRSEALGMMPRVGPDEHAAVARVELATRREPQTWMWLLGVACLLVIVAGAGGLYRRWQSGAVSAPRTLAVLPFSAITGDADGQYVGLGMTDALITRLSGQRQVVVRPLGAVRRYVGTTDPVAAGRSLQVDAVLDGTVQRLAGQTRVTVRLLRVDTGRTQWTGTFDEKTGSVFALEDSISERLAGTMTLQLTDAEQRRLSKPQTRSSEAYDLYTRGRVAWNTRTVESVRRSIGLFEQAIAADPQFAAAYAGLADAYITAGSYGNSFLAPRISAPKAKEAVERALALDPESAEAHTSLAYLRLTYDWDWAGAEVEFKEALRLNPAYLTAHHWYSHELTAQGRVAESLAQSEATLALGPTDVLANEHIAWHHLFAREYDVAATQAAKAVEMDPAFVQSHRVLGSALLYKGEFARACAEFDTGVKLSHEDPTALAYQARCLAVSGHRAEALTIVSRLETAAGERYISAAEIGAAKAALGDKAGALRWLGRAVEERASALIYMNVDPVFDGLRGDREFQGIVRRVGLVPR